MARFLKPFLYTLLGDERYLRLVSRLFFAAYDARVLRKRSTFEHHYFAPGLVTAGDYVLDIGANLGYYTVLFARRVGPSGCVWSVEPIPLYRKVLDSNTASLEQVRILPYALSDRSGVAHMGIPGGKGWRHGLMRLLDESSGVAAEERHAVSIVVAEEALGDIDRLDYVKIDVEGHENAVLRGLEPYLRRFRPLLQIEISPDNRAEVFQLLQDHGYSASTLRLGRLVPLESPAEPAAGDYFFLHPDRYDRYASVLVRGDIG